LDAAHEIETLEMQLAETDHAAEARADLRQKLARLKEAEAAARDARRREREAADAARDVKVSTAAALQERVAPLVAAAGAPAPQFAALRAEVDAYLWHCLVDARDVHRRYLALVAQHNALHWQYEALGARGAISFEPAVPLAAYVHIALRRFDAGGWE
jgi:hypothetical protein